jgi:hypothetical protein
MEDVTGRRARLDFYVPNLAGSGVVDSSDARRS